MGTIINNTLEGNEMTVAQLAVSHPGALAVFTKYNIDYCCGGHRSLTEACDKIGVDPKIIEAELSETFSGDAGQHLRLENWSSTLLIDFIIENHHAYVRMAIPQLIALLDKVCDRHGSDNIELLQIRQCFLDLSEELTTHMEKEEMVLFPAIKGMEGAAVANPSIEKIVRAPISAMEKEHEVAGDLVKQIRWLSSNYTPPEFACPTFQVTYKKLREFDNDLMRHIHLENNILFERLKP